jgi:hypothetical protein
VPGNVPDANYLELNGSDADNSGVLYRLQAGWRNLPRDDKRAVFLLELIVLAISCIGFFSAPDAKAALLTFAIVFGISQSIAAIIVGAVALVRVAIPAKTQQLLEQVGGWVVGVGMLYGVGGYVADWMFPDKPLAIKWRYSLESKVNDPVYLIDKRPHNCEFMSAPIGDKHCHYDREVAIFSNNGHSIVNVTWTKVEE